MSYHFLCKRGIRPARTEQCLVSDELGPGGQEWCGMVLRLQCLGLPPDGSIDIFRLHANTLPSQGVGVLHVFNMGHQLPSTWGGGWGWVYMY